MMKLLPLSHTNGESFCDGQCCHHDSLWEEDNGGSCDIDEWNYPQASYASSMSACTCTLIKY